jgi:hypothetical protein
MAICADCDQEMLNASGCSVLTVNVNNEDIRRLAYGNDQRAPDLAHDKRRCHDCNVTWGHLHHPGCDMEECPHCGGQLISCSCIVQHWGKS